MLLALSRLKHGGNEHRVERPHLTAEAPGAAQRKDEQRLRILFDSLTREHALVDADIAKLTALVDASHLDDVDNTTTAAVTSIARFGPATSAAPSPSLDSRWLDGVAALRAEDEQYRRLIDEWRAKAPAAPATGALALEFDSTGVRASTRPPFIFAISSGRTGTKFFEQLFSSARNVLCFHELHPLMSHEYLRRPLWETYHERMSVKAAAIAGRIAEPNWPANTSFCDTSNYFIKSWWDVAIDRFAADYPIVVVVIRRHMAAVLKSMVDLGWFGGRGKVAGKFLYTANSNVSFVQPLLADEEMDHFDKALTHLFDVEAKAQFFKRRFARHPNVRVHEICLEQVTRSTDAARKFLLRLGLQPTPQTDGVLTAGETNARVDKKNAAVPTNLTYAQQRIDQFVALYRERGVWLPDAPHIDPQFCQAL